MNMNHPLVRPAPVESNPASLILKRLSNTITTFILFETVILFQISSAKR